MAAWIAEAREQAESRILLVESALDRGDMETARSWLPEAELRSDFCRRHAPELHKRLVDVTNLVLMQGGV